MNEVLPSYCVCTIYPLKDVTRITMNKTTNFAMFLYLIAPLMQNYLFNSFILNNPEHLLLSGAIWENSVVSIQLPIKAIAPMINYSPCTQ